MTEYIYIAWFVLALVSLIIEINVMTIYLIALALGAAAGGVADLMGWSFALQSTIAGVVTMIASCASFYIRKSLKSKDDKKINQLDMGQRIIVKAQMIQADGTAKVAYRGADWTAYLEDAIVSPGIYLIDRLDGSRIVLGKQLSNDSNLMASAAQDTASAAVNANSSDANATSSNNKAPSE